MSLAFYGRRPSVVGSCPVLHADQDPGLVRGSSICMIVYHEDQDFNECEDLIDCEEKRLRGVHHSIASLIKQHFTKGIS